MKKIFIKVLAIILALTCTLSMTACNKGDDDTGFETLIIGTTNQIEMAGRQDYNFNVLSAMLNTLSVVRLNENNEYVSNLCDVTTDDSKTWTITVREGMQWHDGVPVTAEDVAFSMEYLLQIPTSGFTVEYESLEVVDERTLIAVLPEVNSRNLTTLLFRPLPKHIYKDITPAEFEKTSQDFSTIGNGPYKFDAYDENSNTLTFSIFEDYVDGTPNVEKVIFKIFDNADTMYLALQSQEIDIIHNYAQGINPSVIDTLAAHENIQITNLKTASNPAALIFKNTYEPFTNIDIKKGIMYAIDYDTIRTTFGSSASIPSNTGFVPPATLGYIETEVLKRDLEKAKEHLVKAGCVDSDNDGIVEYDGAPLSIKLLLRNDNALHMRYAEMLMLNLKDVGIELIIDAVDVAVFKTRTQFDRSQQMILVNLTAYGMTKNAGLGSLYMFENDRMSYAQVYNDTYSALVNGMYDSTSMDEYIKLAHETQEFYSDFMPAIALYWDGLAQAHLKSISNFTIDGTYGLISVATWYTIEKDTSKLN